MWICAIIGVGQASDGFARNRVRDTLAVLQSLYFGRLINGIAAANTVLSKK